MEKVKMEGLYSLRGNAQMQYRYDIEHAPANLAPAEGRTAFIKGQRADAVIGMKSSTLQLTSPLRREGLFSLRGNAQMQYRHLSLQLIDFYSPSLCRFACTDGLRLLSFIPILHLSLQLIDCYRPSLLYINFSALFLLLFPNPILDVVGRHLPIRQIIPESSLFWGFYIVIG